MPKESDFWTVTPFLLTYTGSSESSSTESIFFHDEFNNSEKSNSHTEDHVDEQFLTDSRSDAHICILDFT